MFLDYFIIFIYLVNLLRLISYQIYLWQLKEYRVDRMLAFISTDLGKKAFLSSSYIFKLVILFIILIFIKTLNFELVKFSILFLYSLDFLLSLHFDLKNLRIPVITIKSTIIFVITLFLIYLIFIFNKNNLLIFLLMVDLLLPILNILSIAVTYFPTIISKKIIILFARYRMNYFNEINVIGITGSYGKSSTKEILFTLLSSRFTVAKTLKHINTEIGIARSILKDITNICEYYIVEMGAYKIGEISAICNLVHPKVGIITGINQQHLGLFGTQENIKKAKYELIQNLPSGGFVIYNTGNNDLIDLINWTKKDRPDLKIWTYEILGQNTTYSNNKQIKGINYIYISSVVLRKESTSFIIETSNKKIQLKTNLIGMQYLENVVVSIITALNFGFDITDLIILLNKLTPSPHTMELIKLESGKYIIDDTYNANPDGITKMLDYLNLYQGKKVLIFTPLIELGQSSAVIHQKIAEKILRIYDKIIFTNNTHLKLFKDTCLKNKLSTQISLQTKDFNIKNIINSLPDDSIIVLQGKEAGKLLI